MTETDDLILAIYGIVTQDDAVAPMLVALAQRFGCGSAALFYVHPRRPETTITAAHGPLDDPEVQTRYRREFAALDPAPSAFTHLAVGRVATTDEIFKDPLPLYRRFLEDFYYPLGLRGALGGPIVSGDGRIGMVAVHRGAERAPFGPDDVALLERLTPHIARAIDLRQRFFALQGRSEALGEVFEPLNVGLMLFEQGRLAEANAAARAILARSDGLSLDRNGRLTSPDAGAAGRIEAMLKPTGCGLTSVARTGGGVYGVRVHRLASASPADRPGRCAVLVCDTDRTSPEAAPLLRAIYAMPAQAAQLVATLLKGGSLESYATEAGVSRNTAKFHLKAAFAATGARRQTDLIRRVAPLVSTLAGFRAQAP